MTDSDNVLFGTLVIVLGFTVIFTLIGLGASLATSKFQREAVEHGAAYWCVADHEKTFSWDICPTTEEN